MRSMKSPVLNSLILCALLAAGVPAGVTFSTDFETDQSANFVVLLSAGNDATAEFNYDYSTYVPTSASQEVTVPAAPSGPGTRALRLQANQNGSVGTLDQVSVQTLAGFGGDITLQVDVFNMHNGPAGGSSGSTQVGGPGINGDRTTRPGSGGGQGFVYWATGDGGSAIDYRAYDSNNVASNPANFVTPNGANNSNAGWVALFPNNTGTLAPPFNDQVLPGAFGKKWVVVTITQQSVSGEINVQYNGTEVCSGVPAPGPPRYGAATLGYSDINAGAPSGVGMFADMFILYDNLSVNSSTVPAELSVMAVD